MNNIFERGDRVYHHLYGWGSLLSDTHSLSFGNVNFDNGERRIVNSAYLSYTKYNLKDGGFSQTKSFKLEVGKSYFRDRYDVIWIVINRVNNDDNYGFIDGKWEEKIPCSDHRWREATDEEVKQALEKEIIRRYGENWRDVKIKKDIYPHGVPSLNKGKYRSYIGQSVEGWTVGNHNGYLFYKGIWAEKLEDYEFRPEFEVGELILVRDNDSEDWVTRFFDSYGEDYLVTVGGDTWGQFMRFDESFHNTTKSPKKCIYR